MDPCRASAQQRCVGTADRLGVRRSQTPSRCMDARTEGRYLPLAGPRRFIGDLVHFARRIPSAPVSRSFDVTALVEPRVRHPARPSWSCLFMKAYALVGAEHAPLRRSLLEFPWPRLYEHPWMNCALAIERTYQGEEGVFVGIFRAPERQTLTQLQQAVAWYKNETLEKVGFYRMALRFSHAPTPIAAAALVEHAERLGLQTVQAVWDLRPFELRRTRCRADSPDLAAHRPR